jgi:phosphoribosylanthranilate isomerase
MLSVKVKICCIASVEEAHLAIKHGADAVGLVAAMPSGPGVIADELIAAISQKIHPPVASFLLTSRQSAREIIQHIKTTHTNTVQIVDQLTEGTYHEIKNELPWLKIVQVIHVTGSESIALAIKIDKQVDAILLDSGNPDATLKTLGGTGNTHNWQISKELVAAVESPVFLAGGLNSSNVLEAINTVQPYGVDVCSGVRTNGKLDVQKLKAFIGAVKAG